MTEEQLIQMVKTIRQSSGCMMDLDGLLSKFEAAVENPSVSEFIFVPCAGQLLAPEEVVARAKPKRNAGPDL